MFKRNINDVMNCFRFGAMHMSRLSFSRSVVRLMKQDNWNITKSRWQIDKDGYGDAIYRIQTPNDIYNIVIFSNHIADSERNDRVIAEKWDITFALVKGNITDELLQDMRQNVPLQEAGRNTTKLFVLARANKSVRLFNHLVDSLANGVQPNIQKISQVGYILRTTAVYGNGKFGIAGFELLKGDPAFNNSFYAQMLSVYILRQFSIDLIHHIAKAKGGDKFVKLDRQYQRYLGTGNATGLGMAPYLINHPRVIDAWMSARENALSKVFSQTLNPTKKDELINILNKAKMHLQQIVTINDLQQQLNQTAVKNIDKLITLIQNSNDSLCGDIYHSCEQFCLETQEILVACLLEIYPEITDKYASAVNATEDLKLADNITVGDMINHIKQYYDWAININYDLANQKYWFWYKSIEKEEPRIGVRTQEQGADKELPLDIGRQTKRFYNALLNDDPAGSFYQFLFANPTYRGIARRIWTMGHCQMGDIQANVLAEQFLPMYLLRGKLSQLGATKYDPRSDRWVQVTFFQGAPMLDEDDNEQWLFPIQPPQK